MFSNTVRKSFVPATEEPHSQLNHISLVNHNLTMTFDQCVPKDVRIAERLDSGKFPVRERAGSAWMDAIFTAARHYCTRIGLVQVDTGVSTGRERTDNMKRVIGMDALECLLK